MKITMLFIAAIAIVATAVIAIAGPGARLGLWDYGTGLTIMRSMKFPALVLAVLAGASTIFAFVKGEQLAPWLLAATIATACAAFVPIKFGNLVQANPLIHDITTDFEDPPKIVAGGALPRRNPPGYYGTQKAPSSSLTVAEAQRRAFPDIEPLVVNMDVGAAGELARLVVEEMNMEILDVGTSDGEVTLEATYTSFWFGFVDDFVVRLKQNGENTRIDVRSKSRVGISDLGANANRIREFYSNLRERIPSANSGV
ncbi:MAG: DUF1499 domain-containing protein [Hyphomicrobiaceae bacterium]